jgi:glyceraldehyde 3-phosphate dehydrogenase
MIPTTTGAASAVAKYCRISRASSMASPCACPRPNVSVVDLNAIVDKKTTGRDGERRVARRPRTGPLKGILAVSDAELVSIDFRGNPFSSIVDAPYTK